MKRKPQRLSDDLRPHLHLSRQFVALAIGHPSGADATISAALQELMLLEHIKDPRTLVLCFYALLVKHLAAREELTSHVRLIGQIPLTQQSVATAVLTLDPCARIAFLLEDLVGLSPNDAAFVASLQPEEHFQHMERAQRSLAKILK